ncbi:putative candidate secreted effector protein [Blumeria hordei DH14]|uniref:Putative candidate secreted effector protein n=1 Tax=Blumeria graminis f. sp. hordei (strain DH14) TaxID=546991 RepID=N1JN67_BLUG1|nr:putative candidate secreted effector protein [Blumeria hordei DH14]
MKLIHIISSVVIFSLSVLATNDWDCRGNTIYAYTIDREMYWCFHKYSLTNPSDYIDIPEHHIFKTEFKVPGSNPSGARFEFRFNKDYVISYFVYKYNGQIFDCNRLTTSTMASD